MDTPSLLHLLQAALNFIYLFYTLPQPFLFQTEESSYISSSHLRPSYFFKITPGKAGDRVGEVCLPVSWESCCSNALPWGFSPNLAFQRWLLKQNLPFYSPAGKSTLAFILCSKISLKKTPSSAAKDVIRDINSYKGFWHVCKLLPVCGFAPIPIT